MTAWTRILRAAAAALALALLTGQLSGYSLNSTKFPDGTLAMHMQLGGGSGTLIDGSTSWNQTVTNALATWNTHIDLLKFSAVNDSTSPIGDLNGVNNVVFASTIFGRSFDDDTVALANWWFTGSRRTEGNVTFNTAKQWNSYRGTLRRSGGTTTFDIYRVALHEFGHLLGLNHPDENGQSVSAIMNSIISNLDALTSDDINGARANYGAGVTSNVSFPPRNETADFINRLGVLYRDELRSGGFTTYVDAEGAGVWVPEYTRYRVGQCSHSDASSRVFLQITDGVAYGVCALTPSGPISFPPRTDGVQFMGDLNAVYRDTLRRSATTSFVNDEGIVVWVMEYLRYRLNSCNHESAVLRVFQQIRGQGIQPTCTA